MTSKLITKETANLIITVYIMYTVLIFLLSIYIDTGFNFINYSLKYLEQLYQFAENIIYQIIRIYYFNTFNSLILKYKAEKGSIKEPTALSL